MQQEIFEKKESFTILNLPKSRRITSRFKGMFPTAKFYGKTSLGSGRDSFYINTDLLTEEVKYQLKKLKVTIARYQPFINGIN